MASMTMLLRRENTIRINCTVNAADAIILQRPQQSRRRAFVLLLSMDTCGSMRNLELEENIQERIKETAESLQKAAEMRPRIHPEPCANIYDDRCLRHGKRDTARRLSLNIYRKSDLFSQTRLLYHLQESLREMYQSTLSGERVAEWYREGPPNNQKICHTMNTAA